MGSHSPINFRAFLLVAVIVIGAVFCSYIYMFTRIAGIAVFSVYVSALAVLTAVFTVKYLKRKIKLRVLISIAISLLFSISTFTLSVCYYNEREDCINYGGYRNVTGIVRSIDMHGATYRIGLDDVDFDGTEVSGVLSVTVAASDNNIVDVIDCGDRLSFNAYITVGHLVKDGVVDGSSYRTDVRYYASVRSENVEVEFGEPSVIEKILSGLKGVLIGGMGDRYGNIAFSMITGDKYELDSDIRYGFSASGLGHIMAVSGLHIGFLVLLLNLILCKVDKRVRFGIVTAILILYCILVGLSPSVVRATIMAVVSMFAVFVGGRRDILSSMCFALSAILAVKPLYLFEMGFLLSFGALYGIAMFSDSISKFLSSHGAHRRISEATSSAVSVQIGIMPTQIYFFNTVYLFSTVLNIFLIPYISAVFILTVCLLPIGAIPGCSVILKLNEYLMMPIDYITQGIGSIPNAEITFYTTCAAFLCYPVMFFASRYFMMPKGKLSVILASIAACSLFCTIGVGSEYPNSYIAVTPGASTDSIICDGDYTCIVGEAENAYDINTALQKLKRKNIDEIYLYDSDMDSAASILELSLYYDIGTVYCTKFGDCGAYLIDHGINFVLLDDGVDSTVKIAKIGGREIGYEYRDSILFSNGVEERSFEFYDIVRVHKISEEPLDGVTYLCNTSDLDGDHENVYVCDGAIYTYELTG